METVQAQKKNNEKKIKRAVPLNVVLERRT